MSQLDVVERRILLELDIYPTKWDEIASRPQEKRRAWLLIIAVLAMVKAGQDIIVYIDSDVYSEEKGTL